MYAEHAITKSIAIFATATILINAIALTFAQAENDAPSEVIAGVERYIGERARKVVVVKGRYVGVTYRKGDGTTETVEGFVRAIDETELAIRRDKRKKTIPRTWIEELMVCDNPFQLLHAQNLLLLRRSGKRADDNRRWNPGVVSLGILGGIGGGIIGWNIGANSCDNAIVNLGNYILDNLNFLVSDRPFPFTVKRPPITKRLNLLGKWSPCFILVNRVVSPIGIERRIKGDKINA